MCLRAKSFNSFLEITNAAGQRSVKQWAIVLDGQGVHNLYQASCKLTPVPDFLYIFIKHIPSLGFFTQRFM